MIEQQEQIKEKNKGGRPKKPELNWQQFEELCKIQCKEEEICCVLGAAEGMNGLSVDTLNTKIKEHYGCGFSEAYKRFSGYGKAGLRRLQFRLAERSPAMAIWLGKQYLGQSEKIEVINDDLINETLEFKGVPKTNQSNGRFARFYN